MPEPPPPPPPTDLEFDCPLCDGAFEISSEWLGHEIECPHCGGAVQLQAEEGESDQAPAVGGLSIDAGEPAPAESSPEPESPSEPAGEPPQPAPEPESAKPKTPPQPSAAPPTPRAPLTREERAALRRRLNAILAVAGAVVLVVAFFLLSWLAEG